MERTQFLMHITPLRSKKEIVDVQIEINTNPCSSQNSYEIGDRSTNIYKDIVEDITGKRFSDEDWDYIKDEDKGNLTYACGRKVRSDAVIAAMIVAGYPGKTTQKEDGSYEPIDAEEFLHWKTDSILFMEDYFHKINIKALVLHMDGDRPHLHIVIVPLAKNNKNQWILNFQRAYVNGPVHLRALQTQYENFIGFNGKEGVFRQKKFTENEAMAELDQIKCEALPEPDTECSALEYRDNIVQPMYESLYRDYRGLYLEAKQNRVTYTQSEAQKNQIRELTKQVRELQDQLAEATKQLNQRRLTDTYESTGMLIHPDQDMIKNIYAPLKQSLIMAGKEHVAQRREDRNFVATFAETNK